MSNIPSWWEFLLLALAAYRVFRLIAEDTILDGPRRRLVRIGDWQEGDDEEDLPDEYREKWAAFITCPYCAGFWIAIVWWIAWLIWPHATVLVAVPWAISAAVAFFAKADEKLNE